MLLRHSRPSGGSTVAVPPAERLSGQADLHTHTYHSDGADSPAAVVAEARRRGLDVLAITDHDTVEGALEAARMAGDAGAGSPLEVVVGEEVTSRDGHILGLFLTRRVAPGRSAAETVAAIHAQGGVAIAAHPFWHAEGFTGRRRHGVGGLIAEVPFDAVEVRNGGVTLSMMRANRRAVRAAAALELTGVGGSDAHVSEAVALAVTAFEGRTAEDLRRGIRSGLIAPRGRIAGPRTLWGYASWLWARPADGAAPTPVA